MSSYLFGGALFAVLVGMTAVSSQRVGSANEEAAVAAALRHVLTEFAGEDLIEGRGEVVGPLYLCLSSEVALDVEEVGAELSSTVIVPIPAQDCATKRVEGDFGMFTAMIYHYAPNGDEAAHMTVAGLSCWGMTSCLVDIDMFGSGDRYSLERSSGTWKVIAQRNRWIV